MLSRILAIDYGEKRIGLALTDLMQMFAKPYETIPNEGKKKVFTKLNEIIKEKEVSLVVLGLPLGLEGQHTEKTREILRFHEALEEAIDTPIVLWDERLTTYEAKKELIKMGYNPIKGREIIDAVAAYMILRNYLKANQ